MKTRLRRERRPPETNPNMRRPGKMGKATALFSKEPNSPAPCSRNEPKARGPTAETNQRPPGSAPKRTQGPRDRPPKRTQGPRDRPPKRTQGIPLPSPKRTRDGAETRSTERTQTRDFRWTRGFPGGKEGRGTARKLHRAENPRRKGTTGRIRSFETT